MLKPCKLDAAGESPVLPVFSPGCVTEALGNLVADRRAEGSNHFAIEQLCAALIADAPQLAHSYVDRLLDCGVSVEALYETYIPRTAHRLGEMWVDDRLGFTAVTLGMGRLTEIFRRLSPIFLKARRSATQSRRALFALTPGETHSLGVVMAADHFQRSGWIVRVELQADVMGLERLAGTQEFDLIGLSAGARRSLPVVCELVSTLRRAARPGTPIMLGGPMAALDPTIASHADVDLATTVVREALDEIERGF